MYERSVVDFVQYKISNFNGFYVHSLSIKKNGMDNKINYITVALQAWLLWKKIILVAMYYRIIIEGIEY